MDGTPENTTETFRFLLDTVFDGIELTPLEASRLRTYLSERHEHLHGPYTTVFVLGSYEPPFKWRLEIACDELNNRHDMYAYLLASQRDPDVNDATLLSSRDSDDFPELKAKYYIHAIYADSIALVIEHNEGGSLTELGRNSLGPLRDRTYLFPRNWNCSVPEKIEDIDDARRCGIRSVYETQDRQELQTSLEALTEAAADDGDLSIPVEDLCADLEAEFGDKLTAVRYSSVLEDEFVHFDRAGRCFPWLTQTNLREQIQNVPRS